MAKPHPRKHKKDLGKDPKKARHPLRFVFQDPGIHQLEEGFLEDFAAKTGQDQPDRPSVFCVGKTAPGKAHDHPQIRYLKEGTVPSAAEWNEGYAVIFEAREMSGKIHPGEFFRLPLPESAPRRTWYEVNFRGKNREGTGAVILPARVLRYLLATRPTAHPADPASIRLVLKKLGFVQKEVVINQDSPLTDGTGSRIRLAERMGFHLTWSTIQPWKEARIPRSELPGSLREHPLFRFAFLLATLAVFIILPVLSLDAGLSGDDEKHYEHAIKVFRYFSEDDPSALDDPRFKLNYYGQSFDFFTYLLIRLFNLEDHPYEARHVMVALSGAAAILVTGLLVKLFAGYSGGLLALVLMFLSPRFIGHAFNNPMDIPFALGNIFALYHMVLFLMKLPRFSTRSALWIAVGIGWANGIRIGGLLLVPYLFMFSGLYLLLNRWPWKRFSAGWWRFSLKGLGILLLISVTGYMLSLLTWPYALQDIVHHPIQAFKVMSNIQVSIRVLYDGLVQWSDRLPWHYIPKNVFLTVPVLILLGWMASLFTWFTDRGKGMGFWYFMLWFTVLFPVLFIIYRESNVYGGWRHMLFIYPSMLALSAMAITRIARKLNRKWMQVAGAVLLLLGLIHPLRHVVVNHPNTYIYFNEWAGGINSTYGTYETDYYANSLAPASRLFIDEILPGTGATPEDPLQVVSNFTIGYYFRDVDDRVNTFYSRYYDRGKKDWDYAILYCNYIHPHQLKNGMWPPKNTVAEVRVDDVTVAAVVERKNRYDHMGSDLLAEAIREQDAAKLARARNYLERAIEYDPHNVAAYLELGNAYTAFFEFEDARHAMDSLLKIYPEYDKALNLKGYTYLVEAEVTGNQELIDLAIAHISDAIRSNYKFYSGYYNMGLAYGLKNDRANAEYYLKQAIRYNGKFRAAYEKLAELYEFYGDTEMANRVREQMRRLPS